MKKFVLRLDLDDDKDKRKAMKTVSAVSGIDEISIDMKGKTLTVIGAVDPISVVSKLRKFWPTHIISVGPAKEPEKKEEPKKEDDKKEEPKKEEEKKDEPKNEEPKKEEAKKDEEKKGETEPVVGTVLPYRQYYHPSLNAHYHYAHYSMEENPNACTIC